MWKTGGVTHVPPREQPASRLALVVVTRNRREEMLRTLRHLRALPERPPIVVVDNCSQDGTVPALRRADPRVEVIELASNRGSAARNLGVRHAATPYVAFCDDDSWWEPGALSQAVSLLDRHPRVGLVAARVHVGARQRIDPVCAAMRESPLPNPGRAPPDPARLPDPAGRPHRARLPDPAGLPGQTGPPDRKGPTDQTGWSGQTAPPGRPVLGFLACAAVVRSDAFLAVGGFNARLGVGGEEQLLAVDMAAHGWNVVYADELLVQHHPSTRRDLHRRSVVEQRNALWFCWLRRPAPVALVATLKAARRASGDAAARRALLESARGARWVMSERRPLPCPVELNLRLLEGRSETQRRRHPPQWAKLRTLAQGQHLR